MCLPGRILRPLRPTSFNWEHTSSRSRHLSDAQLWVVDIRTGAAFRPGKPRLLFENQAYFGTRIGRAYDVSPDGQRFLMVQKGEQKPQPVTEMILVQNWFEELKRLCPTGMK